MIQVPDPLWKQFPGVEEPEPDEGEFEPFAMYDPD